MKYRGVFLATSIAGLLGYLALVPASEYLWAQSEDTDQAEKNVADEGSAFGEFGAVGGFSSTPAQQEEVGEALRRAETQLKQAQERLEKQQALYQQQKELYLREKAMAQSADGTEAQQEEARKALRRAETQLKQQQALLEKQRRELHMLPGAVGYPQASDTSIGWVVERGRELSPEIKLQTARQKLRQAETAEQKEEATKELRQALSEYFDHDMAPRQQELKALKERLAKLESQLTKRQAAKDEIVEFQLQLEVREAEGLGFFNKQGPATVPRFFYGGPPGLGSFPGGNYAPPQAVPHRQTPPPDQALPAIPATPRLNGKYSPQPAR